MQHPYWLAQLLNQTAAPAETDPEGNGKERKAFLALPQKSIPKGGHHLGAAAAGLTNREERSQDEASRHAIADSRFHRFERAALENAAERFWLSARTSSKSAWAGQPAGLCAVGAPAALEAGIGTDPSVKET